MGDTLKAGKITCDGNVQRFPDLSGYGSGKIQLIAAAANVAVGTVRVGDETSVTADEGFPLSSGNAIVLDLSFNGDIYFKGAAADVLHWISTGT